jgi:nucleotide-binding universal stress UspA family protein
MTAMRNEGEKYLAKVIHKANEIPYLAEENNIDLIVIGTGGLQVLRSY